MYQLQPILTPKEIKGAVDRLAQDIRRDYQGKNPLLLGVLKGSFIFVADLIRNLDIPLEVEFVALSSYGRGRKESSGKVNIVRGLRAPIKDRHVLVIEDIVDSGMTLNFLFDYLQRRKPASLKVCVLFDKASRRQVWVPVDYLGFSVPDVFIVGYGLDYDENFRHLPGLYVLGEEG